ncbi:MAG TPA: hypothetical protein VHF06_08585 [Pseudonocardiaceae bacterium]|jgi:hypothetical protein|nr:hypothetical protein [Pseudonocardiaceae bacterium]
MSALLAVDRATPGFDVGLAATESPFGMIVGICAAVVLACWRITTPLPPLPPLPAPEDRASG